MKTLKPLFLLLITLSLFACAAQQTNSSDQKIVDSTSIQNAWLLTSIDGQAIDSTIQSTLNIDVENNATGKLACNNFFGTLIIDNNNLKIEQMGSTRMFCQEPVNNIEMIVSVVLTDWSEIQLSKQQLSLAGKTHTLTYNLKK